MPRPVLFFMLFLSGGILSAQECLPGWAFTRAVVLTNTTANSYTDIQLSFMLDTRSLVDSSKMLATGADLRIVDDSCNHIPFYLTQAADDTLTNTVWVKVSDFPAGGSVSLNLYYGNDTASSRANGDEVFIFFDDFSNTEVDSNKWEAIGEFRTLSVSDGRLEYASEGMTPAGPRFKFVRTKQVFSEQVQFDFNAQISNSNGVGFSSADSTLERIIFRQSGFGFDTLNQVAWNTDTIGNGFSISQAFPFIRWERGVPTDGYMVAGVENDQLNVYDFASLTDTSFSADTFTVSQTQMSGFHFILSSFIGFSIYLDYIRVRKVLPDSATAVVLGDEEKIETDPVGIQIRSSDLSLYPNPTYGVVNLTGLAAGNYTLCLLNSQGQRVWNKVLVTSGSRASMFRLPASLPVGLYHLQVVGQVGRHEAIPLLIEAN